MKGYLFTGFFLFLAAFLPAQDDFKLVINWEKTVSGEYSENMREAVLLQDGQRLAIVGEVETPRAGKDGLFILLDATTGQQLVHRTYDVALLDDVLLGIAEAGDGTFYLVGTADAGGAAGKQGWLLRVDEEGNKITDHVLKGQAGDDRFEKIVWLDRGAGLIAGFSATVEPGKLWMLEVDGNTLEPRATLGDGIVDELAGMEKGPGSVWLCGYSKRDRQRNIRRGDIWVLKIDEGGAVLDRRIFPAERREKIHGLTSTLQGKLLLAGETWNANGDTDVWLAELENGKRESLPKTFGSDDRDYAAALFITPGNFKWLVVRRVLSNTTSVQVYYDEEFSEKTIFDLEKDVDFDVKRLFWTAKNTYLMAGNVRTGRNNATSVRLLCLGDNESLASKSLPKLNYTTPVFDDENRDGRLAAGERGTLRFKLINTGDVPITEGHVLVSIASAPEGVRVNTGPIPIGNLPEKAEKPFSVWVKADPGIVHGQVTLDIKAVVNGVALVNFPAVIEGPAAAPAAVERTAASMFVMEPDLSGNASRELVAQNKEVRVRVKYVTPNDQVKTTDFKKYNNGLLLQDEKSTTELTKGPNPERPELFEYIFTYTLQLQSGRNEFYIDLNGDKTAPITFKYTAELPNLYVLAIGVPYGDLKYTGKDAGDFAQAMAAQANRGFFNEVSVRTLTASNTTQKLAIEKSFEDLYGRFQKGNIKSNDYLTVFISGHGAARDIDGDFGLIPSDYDPEHKSSTTVNLKEMIDKFLNKVGCKKIMFIDACHSGVSVSGKAEPTDMRIGRLLSEANRIAAGTANFTSCATNQLSYEDAAWENGAFTEALLEALQGKKVLWDDASDETVSPDSGGTGQEATIYANDSFISLGELKIYLEKRVPYLVSKKRSNKDTLQTPVIEIPYPLKETTTLFQIIK